MNHRKFKRTVKSFWLCCYIIILLNIIYIIYYRSGFTDNLPGFRQMFQLKLPYVVVHLDFKGAPPRLEYLEMVLKRIRKLGANALLVEYEDMFPYEDSIYNLSTPHHYDRYELKNFLTLAAELNFEVIPLVQTFGHMQFALKLAEFKHLRENQINPGSICPSRNESLTLIETMLKQIIDYHQRIGPLKHIHIGCDEVFDLNQCPYCKRRLLPNITIFFEHVKAVVDIVKTLSPNTTVLIWDDMMRDMSPYHWKGFKVLGNVEPVCWAYEPIIHFPHHSLYSYHYAFENIWVASAFKGADGVSSYIPSMINRFLNTNSWLSLMLGYVFAGEDKVYNFKGIILTGWSRYDHFEPICDPLPIAMPSLILNLMLVSRYKNGVTTHKYEAPDVMIQVYNKYIRDDFRKQLKCDDADNLDIVESMSHFDGCLSNVTFPLYYYMQELMTFVDNVRWHFKSQDINDYVQFGYANIRHLKKHLRWCYKANSKLALKEIGVRKHMQDYFETEISNEYIEYKSYSARRYFNKCITSLSKIDRPRTWTRGKIN